MTYQDVVGTLNPGGHPGSYNGQDAYNDLLVTEKGNGLVHWKRASGSASDGPGGGCIELYARCSSNYEGGCNDMSTLVRRLTPEECEALQGFDIGWTDIGEWTDSKGKKHKEADSPRYKAIGNSIALPFWQWLADRIVAQYDRPVTMGSLFDGIGGFPLVFQRAGAEPIWASEIEEFCIAVTKKHFPERSEDGEVD